MASALVNAHIEGQARIRRIVEQAMTAIWNGLPNYDRPTLDQWLSEALPVVEAGQRQSVNLTNAYLARSLERQPLPLDTGVLIGAGVRNGTAPAEVYERPFVTLWGGLSNGLKYEDALSKALSRATSTASMDMQLSMRATAEAVDRADSNIYGYKRVADASACSFCKEVDGAYVKGNSGFVYALHNHCGCGLEALREPHRGAVKLPDGTEIRAYQYGPLNANVAVQHHGELGPVLVKPGDHFTTTSELH